MTPAYMPFTCIPESTARLLTALVGPVVIYQPSPRRISKALLSLASQGLAEVRTPLTRDDSRLNTALTEFMEWARLNPATATAGAGFFSVRQGEIPYFDETTINQIRFDIKQHRPTDRQSTSQADQQSGRQINETEAGFSARLFLALAQENDMATERLDHDLKQFKALEKDFLDTLKDADDAGFERQALGGAIWRDDPGAKLTGQRIRAWATLAAADAKPPELLITTSPSVVDTLLDSRGEAIGLEKLADLRVPVPSAAEPAMLTQVLADLAASDVLSLADQLPANATIEPAVSLTLFGAINRTSASVIGQMATITAAPPSATANPESIRHTLIVLVNG